jgi:tryptophanyl-tRNA synthetase
MSKSYDNTIEIFGPEKLIRKKVMSIVTDSTPVEAPKDLTNSTILQLYRLFAAPEQIASMEDAFRAGGIGYGEFKKQLFEVIWNAFAPMRARRAELEADLNYVDEVLRAGALRATDVAKKTLEKVRTAVGLA